MWPVLRMRRPAAHLAPPVPMPVSLAAHPAYRVCVPAVAAAPESPLPRLWLALRVPPTRRCSPPRRAHVGAGQGGCLQSMSAFWLNTNPASSGGPADHVLRPGDCQYKMARLIINIARYRTAVPACTPARHAATGRQRTRWAHGGPRQAPSMATISCPPPTAVAPASHVRGRARSRKRLLPPSACLCPCLLDVCRASPSARGQKIQEAAYRQRRGHRVRAAARTPAAPRRYFRPPRWLPYVELSISRPDSFVVFTQSP